jgi:hypothetical protein
MPNWLKHTLFILFLVVFAGCAGSCSGCSGCGVTPLDGGFPSENRIQNASSVRLTQSGLQFLGSNLGAIAPQLIGDAAQSNAGVITFEIPQSTSSIEDPIFGFEIGSINVCPDGPKPTANPPECTAEVDLGQANLTIATKAPHNITVTGTLALRLQKLRAKGSGVASLFDLDVVLTDGAACSPKNYANIPINVDISLEADTNPAHGGRVGYSKVDILAINIDQGVIEDSIGFCGNGFDDTFAGLIKGLIIGNLIGGLTDTVVETVEEQLCTKRDTAAGVTCPTGSYPDADDVCRYCTPDGNGMCADSSTECVSLALGIDGNINLSQALASLSPGTKGGFDFLAAMGGEGPRDDGSGFLWGDLNPINGGATLGMLGGAEPQPITKCVPLATLEKPQGIPIPDELTQNTVPGWTGDGPHFGLAVSERYMNYLLGGVYNSGALCLGVGSDTLGSLLTSNTIGLLIPSFKDLARQQAAAPLALVIRPQEPPNVLVGKGTDLATDPLLKLTLNKFNIDFYVWSSDRYIRAFTSTFDIVAPINLDVTDEGLVPVLDAVEVSNPTLTTTMLREDEQTAANALAKIISGQIGSALGGAIGPVNLNDQLSSLGLTLQIPPSVAGQGSPGLTKLEKGTDRFLGIFAAFGIGTPAYMQTNNRADTTVELSAKRVDIRGLELPTITDENRPEIEVRVGSQLDTGANKMEWQYRLNGGLWHPWSSERYLEARDPVLSIQMRHKLEVRSRIAGRPETVDKTPAVLEVLIDKSAPNVKFEKFVKDGKQGVDVSDVVSPKEKIEVRWSVDSQPFGAWTTADTLSQLEVEGASTLSVEAKDEEGNVASVSHNLINGKQDKSLAAESACNCGVVGSRNSVGGWGMVALLLGLGAWFSRTRLRSPRTRTLAKLSALAVGASFSGCSCGSDDDTDKTKPSACVAAGTCEVLTPGLVGAYASATVTDDGSVWVAAYDDLGYGSSEVDGETQYIWGDLVVGKWDGQKVDWAVIDGMPTDGDPPDGDFYDVAGYRRGYTEPGDDVGLWTSIANVGGRLMVAYYDATNRALKVATKGDSWSIHTVQKVTNGDVGRYAKLLVVDGKPVIGYLFMESAGDAAKSGVRIATGKNATPGSESDWTFQDAYTDANTPCRGYLCATGECHPDTGKCSAVSSGCDPKCASPEKCLDDNGTPSCVEPIGKNAPESFPDAAGLYVSLAPISGGLGLVFYDRIHGNVMMAKQAGGTWGAATIVAGQADGPNGPVDTGDVGVGLSLFVDSAGDFHTSYVNGFDETLLYQKISGTTVSPAEIVDDGVVPGGQAVIGADSSIRVTSSGEIQIAYQDATNGEARWAQKTGAAWTKKKLDVEDFAGGFNKVMEVGGNTQVLTWWRRALPRTEGDITLLQP